MIGTNELTLDKEDYDKAFTEVSFLLDMFVDTIEAFVGKSTPSLAVAAGRKMASNLPAHMTEQTPEAALAEFVRIFRIQQMEIDGQFENGQAVITIHHCPIRSVCLQRDMEIDGQICQIFHYYVAGILAELAGCPARPKTVDVGEQCTFNMAFSGVRR
jgi:predicted ArsR family transcriptional regulator